MEKKIKTILLVAVIWLLSLVVVAQCAIRETNQRRPIVPAERSFSISPTHYRDYNIPLTGFEVTFKEGFTNRR